MDVSYMFCFFSALLFSIELSSSQDVDGAVRITEQPEDTYLKKPSPTTLSCSATGSPKPSITWYKDGKLVEISRYNPGIHRVLLEGGSLFLLFVNSADLGVYYCNATNIHGTALSRNATLSFAMLKKEFLEQPTSQKGEVGRPVTLMCRPPRGLPAPTVSWKKNGIDLDTDLDSAVSIEPTGSLVISSVRQEHAGTYVCVARNPANSAESIPAILSVYNRVEFIERPKPTTALKGKDAMLNCSVRREANATIKWTKAEGILDSRSRQLSNGSLYVRDLELSDEAIYTCHANNALNYMNASAKLSVHSRPSFSVKPVDKHVGVGRDVSFLCRAVGKPTPAKFWQKEDQKKEHMYPGQKEGRLLVAFDGTLIIRRVQLSDAGNYICLAMNVEGEALTKATLTVDPDSSVGDDLDLEAHHWIYHKQTFDDREVLPPPIIYEGPRNQTVATNTNLSLVCESRSDPKPALEWLKDGTPLQLQLNSRLSVASTGLLQILRARESDSGRYTCRAVSRTGEASWHGWIHVVDAQTSDEELHRPAAVSDMPGPPSKPEVSDVTERSVRLSWRPSLSQGASPQTGYVIEYYSHHLHNGGWNTAKDGVVKESDVVTGLEPGVSYVFIVRAKNRFGVGAPSPPSDTVLLHGGTQEPPILPEDEESVVKAKLVNSEINLLKPKALSPSSVILTWEVRAARGVGDIDSFIQGFIIQYRLRFTNRDVARTTNWMRREVRPGRLRTAVLDELKPHHAYQVRVQAFYHNVRGLPSNTEPVRTLEAAPGSAPRHVRAEAVSSEAIRVHWEPPAEHTWNGAKRSYKVYWMSRGSHQRYNKSVNGTVHSLVIAGLQKGNAYNIQVAAVNRMGEGPASDQGYTVSLGGAGSDGLEPWLLGALIGGIGGALWIALCGFSLWLCRRRKLRQKELKSNDFHANTYNQAPAYNEIHLMHEIPHDATNLLFENSAESDYQENGRFYNVVPALPGQHTSTFQTKTPITEIPAYASASLIKPDHNTYCLTNGTVSSNYTSPMAVGVPVAGQPAVAYARPDIPLHTHSSDPNTDHTDVSRHDQLSIEPQCYSALGASAVEHYTPTGGSMYREPFTLGDLLPPPPSHPPPDDNCLVSQRAPRQQSVEPSCGEYHVNGHTLPRDFYTLPHQRNRTGKGTTPRYGGTPIPHPNPYDLGLEVEQGLLEARVNGDLHQPIQAADTHINSFTHEPSVDVATDVDKEIQNTGCLSPSSTAVTASIDESLVTSWVCDGSEQTSGSEASGTDSLDAGSGFTEALVRAAENSGYPVSAPHNTKHISQVTNGSVLRPVSPYSTDSNRSSIPAHKPYPKSQRKKQLQDQAARAEERRSKKQAYSQRPRNKSGETNKAKNRRKKSSVDEDPSKLKPLLPLHAVGEPIV